MLSSYHPYICECQNTNCQLRIYLTPFEYLGLSKNGYVVHESHANRWGKIIEDLILSRIREGIVMKGDEKFRDGGNVKELVSVRM